MLSFRLRIVTPEQREEEIREMAESFSNNGRTPEDNWLEAERIWERFRPPKFFTFTVVEDEKTASQNDKG